jgi:ubiquinone/menaquinone biosynthesis C-methylase UbiE
MSGTSAGRPARTAVAGQERPFLPGMSSEWLLPLYDPLTRLLGVRRIHRRLLDQAALRPGQRVLEIGCGTGNLLLQAKATEPGAIVVGLDPDLSALARARRKARRRSLTVQLDRGYADDLPYADGSMDVVLSAFMLHHLPTAEKDQALREVFRVLRPDGQLHVVDIGGRADPADGRMARRAHHIHRLQDNWNDAIPDLFRRTGFTAVTETGHAVGAMGRFTFYRGSR